MIIKHNFRDLISKINWEAYFMDWKYHKRFATIANAQGCDVVKASWLIDFEEKDRATASEVISCSKRPIEFLSNSIGTTLFQHYTNLLMPYPHRFKS